MPTLNFNEMMATDCGSVLQQGLKHMIFRLILAEAIILILSSSLAAQTATQRTLFAAGNWTVTETIDPDDTGSGSCHVETLSGANQLFTLEGQSDNLFEIAFWDNRWKIKKANVSIVVAVDNSEWPMDGTANTENIGYRFDDKAPAHRFIKEVAAGNRVTVMDDFGREIATFSLAGSSAALSAFSKCWARLQASGTTEVSSATSVGFGGTLKDSTGVIYSVERDGDGSGVLLESTNTGGTEHESFGLFDGCLVFSFRYGYGIWGWENAGFFINFDNASFSFPVGKFPTEIVSCKT
jgi:hypothetical protein